MKYARLTKEQLEALHEEFARFLASQQIDRNEWEQLKQDKPEVAEQELDVFSDLIWEGVLSRCEYLEHFSPSHGFLFHCQDDQIASIILKAVDPTVNFLTQEGVKYIQDHLFTDAIEIRIGQKPYTVERNSELFDLIQKGAILSDGMFYQAVNSVINSEDSTAENK